MTDKKPLVSIVIPCYNHAQFVQETIQSVIEQDYINIELIIIDDGSKDNSVKVIQEMIPACKERFSRFEFRHRSNKGLCVTLNEALKWCEGEYFSPVASDDILMSMKVKTQINKLCLLGEEYVGIFGAVHKIDDNGQLIGSLNYNNNSIYSFLDIYLHRHNLPACSQMLKTNSVREVNGYSEEFKIEDWHMWLKLTKNNNFLMSMAEHYSYYRYHPSNTSSNTTFMHKERIKIALSPEWEVSNEQRKLALSACYLSTSLQEKSRFKKIKYILKSIAISRKIIFEKKFYISLFRVLF